MCKTLGRFYLPSTAHEEAGSSAYSICEQFTTSNLDYDGIIQYSFHMKMSDDDTGIKFVSIPGNEVRKKMTKIKQFPQNTGKAGQRADDIAAATVLGVIRPLMVIIGATEIIFTLYEDVASGGIGCLDDSVTISFGVDLIKKGLQIAIP